MKQYSGLLAFVLFMFFTTSLRGQLTEPLKPIVDVVLLKDGSRLSGTILKWELARGMEFKLITGAEIVIPREEIIKVYQDLPFASQPVENIWERPHGPRPYAFREEGLYNTLSFFLNVSTSGGVGIHYSIGHRFNRLLGVGIGTGIEAHDFFTTRNIVPVYAEARGFFVPKRISPYYALKIGYGFALKDELSGTFEAKGGFHFSPEIGVRFGGRAVNYYLGIEYKLQNATFTSSWTPWGGQGEFTEKVSYRRTELRMGLLF